MASSSTSSATQTTFLPVWCLQACYRILALIYSHIFLRRTPILKLEPLVQTEELDCEKPVSRRYKLFRRCLLARV